MLVEAIAVGVCGTDVEIVEASTAGRRRARRAWCSGTNPSAGCWTRARPAALQKGDLVVGIVRRPDPVPCPNCAVGEWDMCRNGQYTERGIKQIDGFMSERWRIEPEYAMKVDRSLGLLGVLLEPTTVVTKAWEQVVAVGQRAFWEPRTVLVTGAGPIGLLAALVGKQHGLDVHVLDRVESGPKPELVRALGATYHTGSVADVGFEPDVIVECTGVGQVIADSIQAVGAGRRRVPHGRRQRRAHDRARRRPTWRPTSVLQNNVVVGSVNANKRHWYKAGEVLARADRAWLARLITRRERPEDFVRALRGAGPGPAPAGAGAAGGGGGGSRGPPPAPPPPPPRQGGRTSRSPSEADRGERSPHEGASGAGVVKVNPPPPPSPPAPSPTPPGPVLDVLIRAGLTLAMAMLCYRVFAPFLPLMVWALILAVTLYPLHQSLASTIGGKQGLAATLLVVVGVVLIVVPTAMLLSALGDAVHQLVNDAAQHAEALRQD